MRQHLKLHSPHNAVATPKILTRKIRKISGPKTAFLFIHTQSATKTIVAFQYIFVLFVYIISRYMSLNLKSTYNTINSAKALQEIRFKKKSHKAQHDYVFRDGLSKIL